MAQRIRISICPTDLDTGDARPMNGERVLAELTDWVIGNYPTAAIDCMQIGYRQGQAFATVDNDETAGQELMQRFWSSVDRDRLFA